MRILGARIMKMVFQIERYGSGRFGRQNGLFRRVWGYLWDFLVALAKFGNFQVFLVDFCSVGSG
jgi:hypothetical protein